MVAELRMDAHSVVLLDGDDVRDALLNDLAFSEADRSVQFERLLGLAALLNNQVEFVVVCAVSFFERSFFSKSGGFERVVVVRIDATQEALTFRNQRGLYGSGLGDGPAPNLPGVNQKWMRPERPDFIFHADLSGGPDVSSADFKAVLYSR